jgi:hypothetical protein
MAVCLLSLIPHTLLYAAICYVGGEVGDGRDVHALSRCGRTLAK